MTEFYHSAYAVDGNLHHQGLGNVIHRSGLEDLGPGIQILVAGHNNHRNS